jgi:hypothetical protein
MKYKRGLIISYYSRLVLISNHVFLYVYAMAAWLGKIPMHVEWKGVKDHTQSSGGHKEDYFRIEGKILCICTYYIL